MKKKPAKKIPPRRRENVLEGLRPTKTQYRIPDVVVEMVPWRGVAKPWTEIKRVVLKEASAGRRRRGRRAPARSNFPERARYKEPDLVLSLGCSVVQAARLKPGQWDLIAGAEYVPGRKAIQGRGRRRGGTATRAYASATNHVPVRTITLDLTYPLDMTARVTIKPYQTKNGSSGWMEEMDLGYVLHQIARAYVQIYRSSKKWGVWGHAIRDLAFEEFKLSDNVGEISIGS